MDKNKKNVDIKEVENVVNEKTTEKTDEKVSKPKKEGVAKTPKKLEDMTTQEINELIKKVEAKNYTTPTTTLEEAEERAGSKIELTKDGLIYSTIKYNNDGYSKLLDFVMPISIIGITIASYFLIHISKSVFWNIIFSLFIGIVSGMIFSVIICDILFKIFASKEEKEKAKKNNEKLAIINTLEKKLNLVKLPYHTPISHYESPKTKFIEKHTLERCPKCGHQLTFLDTETRGSEGKSEIGAYFYTHFTPDKIGERRKTEYKCSKCNLHITQLKKSRQFFKVESRSDYNEQKQWTEIEIQYSTPDNVDPSISGFLKKYSGKARFDNQAENEFYDKEEQRKIKSGENW